MEPIASEGQQSVQARRGCLVAPPADGERAKESDTRMRGIGPFGLSARTRRRDGTDGFTATLRGCRSHTNKSWRSRRLTRRHYAGRFYSFFTDLMMRFGPSHHQQVAVCGHGQLNVLQSVALLLCSRREKHQKAKINNFFFRILCFLFFYISFRIISYGIFVFSLFWTFCYFSYCVFFLFYIECCIFIVFVALLIFFLLSFLFFFCKCMFYTRPGYQSKLPVSLWHISDRPQSVSLFKKIKARVKFLLGIQLPL